MNSLNSLKTLIYKLSKEELKSFLKYLKYYSENNIKKDENELRSVKLIQIILDNREFTSVDLQKALYGKISYNTFNKLVNRLKEKLYEVILFDSNIKKDYYSKRNKVVFELRKKLIQVDILQLKGVRNEIEPVYNYIISKSKRFELYDVLVQSLYSQQRLLVIQNNDSKLYKIKFDIDKAEKCWLALNQSQSIYNEIINKISTISSISYQEELSESVFKLEENFKKTDSSTIGYYLFSLKAEIAQLELNYVEAHHCFNKTEAILKNNEGIFTTNRYGTVLINIANNYIFLKKFKLTIEFADNSKKYFQGLILALSIVNEILFYAYFYLGKLEVAFDILVDLRKSAINSNTLFLISKRNYLVASLNFIAGNFESSLISLNETNEITKDKEGLNLNKRILTILNRIELDELESVDMQVQNLEKFIKRILKTKQVRPRYILILRILVKLINENYNYKKVFSSRKKYFDLLSSDDPQYTWQIKSPELVVFHKWFEAKMKREIYNHSQVMHELCNIPISTGA